MNKKIIEFDRTFFKTHKSRSTNFTPYKTSGFTLIELLVVISIIALLSTVVLSAVSDARVKARNTAKNSLVLEYVKALELYRSNNGSYPSAGTGIEILPKCIGYTSSENCHHSIVGSDSINSSFSTFLPGNFAERNSFMINIGGIDRDMKGVTYKCNSSTCTSYTLTWYLQKNISTCIKTTGSLFPSSSVGPDTICTYTLN